MKKTVNLYDFREEFNACSRGDNFSYEGLEVLFDYLENYESDIGTELELDVIALCCDFSEETPADIAANYGIDLSDCEGEDEEIDAVIEYLSDHTSVCGRTVNGTVVYQQF